MSSKQFVRVSKQFGFNRNRLLYWEFFPPQREDEEEVVHLYFEEGAVVLERPGDVQAFRNWTENEAEAAPPTYQHTMFEPARAVDV